jgi:hypothetical protein
MSSIPTEPFRTSRLVTIGGALALLLAPLVYAPYVEHGPVLCPWHGLLGLPCPGCGLTRAFCALVRGDVRAALALNALSLPLFATLVVTPFVAGAELVRGAAYEWTRRLHSRRVAWTCAVVVMGYHVGRVGYWALHGTLVDAYLRTSWTYAWYHALVG